MQFTEAPNTEGKQYISILETKMTRLVTDQCLSSDFNNHRRLCFKTTKCFFL